MRDIKMQFVVAAKRPSGMVMVEGFSTRDRAALAIAESHDRDPLDIVYAEVWYADNGNVRRWQPHPLPKQSFPCVFDVDLETEEATGTLAPFCSDQCRSLAGGEQYPGFQRAVLGASYVDDFGFQPQCQECGAEIRTILTN